MQLRIININILIDNQFQYKISISLCFSGVTAEEISLLRAAPPAPATRTRPLGPPPRPGLPPGSKKTPASRPGQIQRRGVSLKFSPFSTGKFNLQPKPFKNLTKTRITNNIK
jgi:hypothetical protein